MGIKVKLKFRGEHVAGKYKKYRINLRRYIVAVSIGTIFFSCLVSSLLVILGVKIFYSGEITRGMAGAFFLFILFMSVGIGSFLLWIGTGHLTTPLIEVSNAVKQIADGNFKVKIDRKEIKSDEYEYSNEIDELAKNINKMAAELDGMEYMRKDFMSSVSHEIKTPIAAITGFTEILLDEFISESERKEYLKVINKESIRISRLCENMLSMSRLDNQVLITKKEKIRLDEQIRKCVILLSEKWSDRDIDFIIDLDSIEIISDYDMLYQVWINLIDNAIKYSKESCCISISAGELDDKTIEVKIIDNGIGIEKDKIKKIFEKFYQCEESHKKSGTGLGLSIVKRIIELLDGTIECRSEESRGTEMIVRIAKS